ncbi:MAG TPA: pyridoxamine 5'-phosphate oxidase family protein [Thermoanaerobaculia bacterium]|nr:pyridoxamine 5'-phosphate oxidase family protein [Thermoanaerobaculia bacterium]
MSAEAIDPVLRELLATRTVAALGTLHEGAPYVSMVPFAILPDGSAFLIHVSELSAHTADMFADPRVSLLVVGAEGPGVLAQELPRVTILGKAEPVPDPSPEYEAGKARYLERFPDAEPIFQLGGFSLFTIRPDHVRWIGGFAGAQTLTPGELVAAARKTR